MVAVPSLPLNLDSVETVATREEHCVGKGGGKLPLKKGKPGKEAAGLLNQN